MFLRAHVIIKLLRTSCERSYPQEDERHSVISDREDFPIKSIPKFGQRIRHQIVANKRTVIGQDNLKGEIISHYTEI